MTERYDLDVRVRRAEMSDAAALADLMTQLGYTTRTSEMEMRMEAIQADKNYATFVAAKAGEGCGGVGTFSFFSHQHNNTRGRTSRFLWAWGGPGRRIMGLCSWRRTKPITRRDKP